MQTCLKFGGGRAPNSSTFIISQFRCFNILLFRSFTAEGPALLFDKADVRRWGCGVIMQPHQAALQHRRLQTSLIRASTSPTPSSFCIRLLSPISHSNMPLTTTELKLKAQNAARLEIRAKSTGIPSALLAALENSKPTLSIPQEIFFPLSKTFQTVYKSLSNLVNQPSSSLASKAREHGVPTGLFRLPLEIREQIYGLVIGHKTVLKIPENYHKHRSSRLRSNNGSTSLLQTCRQM